MSATFAVEHAPAPQAPRHDDGPTLHLVDQYGRPWVAHLRETGDWYSAWNSCEVRRPLVLFYAGEQPSPETHAGPTAVSDLLAPERSSDALCFPNGTIAEPGLLVLDHDATATVREWVAAHALAFYLTNA